MFKMKKKKSGSVLNYFIYGIIVLVILVGLWTLFDYVHSSRSNISINNGTVYNGYNIYEEYTGVITLYSLEVISNDKTYYHKFRYYPTDLLGLRYEKEIESKVLSKDEDEYKDRIYISVDPNMTSDEVLSTGILAQILGRNSYGIFKIKSVLGAFSRDYEGEDHPIKNCNDATRETGVIMLQYGNPRIYSEGECVVIQGKDVTDFRMLNERLAYGLLEVIE